MKIVIDSEIPYMKGVFEPFFEQVIYMPGCDISATSAIDATALIVRTRTRCNKDLLERSAVRFIATATIGTDHIDLQYCRERGIGVFSSSGCNARAVAQWVFAAIDRMGSTGTIGIVGVGNVGSEVCQMAQDRGMKILLNDPPRAARERNDFVELNYLLTHSDIVTIHVPLTDSTRGMVDMTFLDQMKIHSTFLNSSRGEVVDEKALEAFDGRFALDVWQGEPNINLRLLKRASIATPHVAGYSDRGKARASEMCIHSVGEFFEIDSLCNWHLAQDFALEIPQDYDITIDDRALRANPSAFESLRRVRTTK